MARKRELVERKKAKKVRVALHKQRVKAKMELKKCKKSIPSQIGLVNGTYYPLRTPQHMTYMNHSCRRGFIHCADCHSVMFHTIDIVNQTETEITWPGTNDTHTGRNTTTQL